MKLKPVIQKCKRYSQIISSSPTILFQGGKKLLNLRIIPELFYISPQSNWVTDWVGHYITTEVKHQFNWPTHLLSAPHLIFEQIIHYGELGTFLHFVHSRANKNNKILVTVFHGNRSTQYPDLSQNIGSLIQYCHIPIKIITACQGMYKRLLDWGIPEQKIACIPLGIDLSIFKPTIPARKMLDRHRLGIPDNAICIGSFQKDGIGWEKGLEPKLIKGPDIFLKVIARLNHEHNIFILLSGPARGYVIRGLQELNIPYRHVFLEDFKSMPRLYHCLDLYLVTSREEGGPSSVLESLACGVPIVSTRVGLAPDIIQHQRNGLLAEIDQVDQLYENCQQILSNTSLHQSVIENGLKDIESYDWKIIASRYYHEIYQPLRYA